MRVFLCEQKTAYEMRISDWSSDGCSSDLFAAPLSTWRAVERQVDLGHRAPHSLRSRDHVAMQHVPDDKEYQRAARTCAGCRTIRSTRSDRNTVVSGKSGSERVAPGGVWLIKNKTHVC